MRVCSTAGALRIYLTTHRSEMGAREMAPEVGGRLTFLLDGEIAELDLQQLPVPGAVGGDAVSVGVVRGCAG